MEGKWAIISRNISLGSYAIGFVEKVTPRMVHLGEREGCYAQRVQRSDVVGIVSDKAEAQSVLNKIKSARGEHDRRVRSARLWFSDRLAEILEGHRP